MSLHTLSGTSASVRGGRAPDRGMKQDSEPTGAASSPSDASPETTTSTRRGNQAEKDPRKTDGEGLKMRNDHGLF